MTKTLISGQRGMFRSANIFLCVWEFTASTQQEKSNLTISS